MGDGLDRHDMLRRCAKAKYVHGPHHAPTSTTVPFLGRVAVEVVAEMAQFRGRMFGTATRGANTIAGRESCRRRAFVGPRMHATSFAKKAQALERARDDEDGGSLRRAGAVKKPQHDDRAQGGDVGKPEIRRPPSARLVVMAGLGGQHVQGGQRDGGGHRIVQEPPARGQRRPPRKSTRIRRRPRGG